MVLLGCPIVAECSGSRRHGKLKRVEDCEDGANAEEATDGLPTIVPTPTPEEETETISKEALPSGPWPKVVSVPVSSDLDGPGMAVVLNLNMNWPVAAGGAHPLLFPDGSPLGHGRK